VNAWFRGGALAGGAILLVGMGVGAQIREIGPGPGGTRQGPGVQQRAGHPEVLWNTRGPEFEGGDRVVLQFALRRIDPKAAVGRVPPPQGVDGIIVYPASRLLMVRGLRDAVASYRSALEKIDREGVPAAVEAAATPEIRAPVNGKLSLQADRLVHDGAVTRATGHVVIGLADGIELHAQQVRITREGGQQRIVIER
jgi:hypothetical protein